MEHYIKTALVIFAVLVVNSALGNPAKSIAGMVSAKAA